MHTYTHIYTACMHTHTYKIFSEAGLELLLEWHIHTYTQTYRILSQVDIYIGTVVRSAHTYIHTCIHTYIQDLLGGDIGTVVRLEVERPKKGFYACTVTVCMYVCIYMCVCIHIYCILLDWR
jgi:hypothetical protein